MYTLLTIYVSVAAVLMLVLGSLVIWGTRSKRNYMQPEDCLLVLAGMLGLSVVWPFVMAMFCGVWCLALLRGRERHGQAG